MRYEDMADAIAVAGFVPATIHVYLPYHRIFPSDLSRSAPALSGAPPASGCHLRDRKVLSQHRGHGRCHGVGGLGCLTLYRVLLMLTLRYDLLTQLF